jgi:DNA-binding beta-propeller fold protein YncE
VLDTKTLKVSARYKMKGCVEPSGLAYAPPYNLLISSCSNGHAKVIDAATGAQVADIPVGPHPDAVIYDQARGVAYIPSAGSLEKNGEITVLKVAGAKAVTLARRIPTQRGARTGAEDPTTGLLYLPTATYVLKAGPPTTAPGTFRILIVDPASSPAARK